MTEPSMKIGRYMATNRPPTRIPRMDMIIGSISALRLSTELIGGIVVGAALVIAMVDVPLFINSVEIDLERSAVVAGAILSALTAAMAVMSYVGGRLTERWWYRPPVLAGLAMSTASYAWMGATWNADTSYPVFAVQLALLGAGFGLTVAPTTSAIPINIRAFLMSFSFRG